MTIEKICIYVIFFIGLAWGMLTQTGNIWLLMYKVLYSVPFWGYPLILLYDLWFTITKKNSKSVAAYYNSIATDLIAGALLACFIISLFYFSGTGYTNSSIDVGSFGAAFVILALIKLIKISKFKIAGLPINTKFIALMSACILGFIALMISSLSQIMRGELQFWQSLWLQITFLSTSIFLLVEVGRMIYFIETSKMSPSLGISTFFERTGSKCKYYENAVERAEKWNSEIKIRKAKNSAEIRKKYKK